MLVLLLKNNENIPNGLMTSMNDSAKDYYKRVFYLALDGCNKNVLEIVQQWKSGRSIYTEEMRNRFSEKDLDDAYGRIMEIIHMGCG